MSRLQERRKQKAQQAEPASTTKGDRVTVIDANQDQDIKQMVLDHYHGKILKKDSDKYMGRADNLKRVVREQVISTRCEDRPKRFQFTAELPGGEEHTVTINVRENGYRSFGDDVREKILKLGEGLVKEGEPTWGEKFLEAAVTETAKMEIDFSLIPADKQDEVFDHLLKVNKMCGCPEDGSMDVVKEVYGNQPKTVFQSERGKLTEARDRALEKILQTPTAFSR